MPSNRRSTHRAPLALLATLCSGLGLLLTGAAPAQAETPCKSTSLAEAAAPGSCWVPFSSGSTFTTELAGDAPLAPNNAAVQQHMAAYGWTIGPDANGFSIGADEGSRPVYYASPSDPTMTIDCTSSEGPGTCTGANHVDINGATINVPAGAAPEANWDAHMTIVETATGDEYDLWHASISGSTITAGTGAETNVTRGDGTGSEGDAADLALSAGLLRPAELMSGHIDHALVVVVPCTNATGADTGYTWPAGGGWGEYCGQYWDEQASSAPELGQLMKLDLSAAQIAASGAPAWEQTIMTALAQYGAYIEDTEGSWHNEGIYILTQASTSWTDLGESDGWTAAASSFGQHGSNLSSNVPIPTRDLELVDTCVTHGTCPDNGDPAANSVGVRSSHHASSRRVSRLRERHLRRERAERRRRARRLREHRSHRAA